MFECRQPQIQLLSCCRCGCFFILRVLGTGRSLHRTISIILNGFYFYLPPAHGDRNKALVRIPTKESTDAKRVVLDGTRGICPTSRKEKAEVAMVPSTGNLQELLRCY